MKKEKKLLIALAVLLIVVMVITFDLVKPIARHIGRNIWDYELGSVLFILLVCFIIAVKVRNGKKEEDKEVPGGITIDEMIDQF